MHTPSLIRLFKRHYHNVRGAFDELGEQFSFELKVHASSNSLGSELITPDESATIRFVILMRRFLVQEDRLYYRTVWEALKSEFDEEITSEDVTRIESIIEQINQSQFSINFKGVELTPARIYEIISDGGFFKNVEAVAGYLSEIKAVPVAGQLLWHQFYCFSVDGFVMCSMIFDVIQKIILSDKFRSLYGASKNAPKKCIYCLSSEGSFKSEEHIFPESLGNDELVLSPGYVCDTCNNGVLSVLDNELLKSAPIAFLQVYFVPYNKNGHLPNANFQNMTMERKGPLHLKVVAKDKTGYLYNKRQLGDGQIAFTLSSSGRMVIRQLARSLYKIVLGMVAFKGGHTVALDSRFDAARDFILNNKGFPNNLLMQMSGTPNPQLQTFTPNYDRGLFMVGIYGLNFIVNIEPYPVLEVDENLKNRDFKSFSLMAA